MSGKTSTWYDRTKGVLAFFIGIFGAMAILGVFFKIMKYDNYVLFMQIGFIGEAAAFVTMGVLEFLGIFSTGGGSSTAVAASGSADITPKVQEAVVSTFVRAVEAKLDTQLDGMIAGLSQEVDQFSDEMRALGSELALSRNAIHGMRAELDAVASGDLAGDAARLGQGMAVLGSEMAGAGQTVEVVRAEIENMANRFRNFNGGTAHNNGTHDSYSALHRAQNQ